MGNCELCGQPMPEGEEMFRYHGYSGKRPSPPLVKKELGALVHYVTRESNDGSLWLDLHVNGSAYQSIGPFVSLAERQRALDDLLQMGRSTGAVDLPVNPQ